MVYEDYEDVDLQIPYIPGYLAFRECPSFQQLLQRVALTHYNPQVPHDTVFGVAMQSLLSICLAIGIDCGPMLYKHTLNDTMSCPSAFDD